MPGRRPGSSRRPSGSQSRIVIRDGDREADAKSLIALLGLTIRPSSEITLAGRSVPTPTQALSRRLRRSSSPYVSPAG